ncbi:MAG: hypothetical protein ACTHKJ_06095, partial [Candidatus Nitrosocosmicus sp.]
MKKSSRTNDIYIFYIFFAFIFIGSTIVLTTIINLQQSFSQGYIPPPLTTSTNQNDRRANNNNNIPS